MMKKLLTPLICLVVLTGPFAASVCVACCPQQESVSVSSLPACCGDCPSTIERQPAPASSPSKTTLDDAQPVTLVAPGPAPVALAVAIRPLPTHSRGLGSAPSSLPVPLRL